MRPDHDFADIFGLSFVGVRPEQLLQYFAFDILQEPGSGIVGTSLQYHGQADNYSLTGALPLAYLWSDMSTPTGNPAVSINSYGSGKAAASRRRCEPPNASSGFTQRTLEGIESVNMMRTGQVKRLAGNDTRGQAKFVASLFRIAA